MTWFRWLTLSLAVVGILSLLFTVDASALWLLSLALGAILPSTGKLKTYAWAIGGFLVMSYFVTRVFPRAAAFVGLTPGGPLIPDPSIVIPSVPRIGAMSNGNGNGAPAGYADSISRFT